MLKNIITALSVSSIVSFISCFFLRKLAFAIGFVDKPGEERKIHKDAMPILGGASFVLGVLAWLSCGNFFRGDVAILLTGAFVIFVLNLIDDRIKLSARFRFITEVLVSLYVIVFADAKISFLPSGFFFDFAEIVITLVWFVGLLNAINYLDGMNGLAAGNCLISFLIFAFMLIYTRQYDLGFLCLACAGVCLGYLPHNFPEAKMFMGDSGSTFLGFILAGIGLTGEWAKYDIVRIASPVMVLSVPIFDMTYTTIMRIKENKIHNIYEWLQYAGKDHFHHTLVDLGLSRKHAVMFIWLTALTTGMGGILIRKADTPTGILAIVQMIFLFGMVGILIAVGKQKKSGW